MSEGKYEQDGPIAQEIAAVMPYYPFKGIPRFYDIGGFLSNPPIFQKVVDVFVARCREMNIDKIFGFDARGFILGPPIALALQKPFYMFRKKGKMPNAVSGTEYTKEYAGADILTIQRGAVNPGDRCLLIDDLVATGGTLMAGIELIKLFKGVVVECACVVEIKALNARQAFEKKGYGDVPIWGLISEEILTLEGTLPEGYVDDGEAHGASTTAPTEEKKEPVTELLSLDTAKALLTDFINVMTYTIQACGQAAQELYRQGKTEEEILETFNVRYVQMLTDAHAALLRKYNTTEEAADMAATLYATDPEYKALTEKLERMSNAVAGQAPSQSDLDSVPSWIDEGKMIEIFGELMQAVTESLIFAMRTVYTETEPPPTTATKAEKDAAKSELEKKVARHYQQLVEENKRKFFEKWNIDEKILDFALQKYGKEGPVVQAMQQLQRDQQSAVEAFKTEIMQTRGWNDEALAVD
jgi:adenine phosphoribosyltransferase